MRDLIRQAVEGARDEMRRFTREVVQDRTLSEEEMVQRYMTQHRGNAQAMIDFARRAAPSGTDALRQAVRYEQQMERLIQARGG